MKSAKIFIVFTFLLAFAVCVSAQSKGYIKNLGDYDFLEEGKIKDLQLTVSTKEDVKKTFGENCEKKCDYDEDWEILFSYVNDRWFKRTFVGNNEKPYKPKLEFIGKLGGIIFQPKKQILLSEASVIPEEFECRNNFFTTSDKTRFNSRTCIKNKRIIYIFSNETTADGKIFKGQLILIHFALSKKEGDEIFVLVKK